MVKKLLLSFLKGILAGLAIGLGGFLYVLMTYLIEGTLGKIVGSLLFSIGLLLVCTFNLHLYTGKIGGIYFKKQTIDYYISLPIMLVANAIGSVGLGYILFFIFRNTDLINNAYLMVESRIELNNFNDYLILLIGSFLCGFCVYMAVKLFNIYRLKPLGILLLIFFVFIFVFSGFQHCIANMFYFAFANRFIDKTFINLIMCILFNSLGPIIGALIPIKENNYH